MIFKMLKDKITRGNYNQDDLKNKMDVYLLCNRISDDEYKELMELMK